jgi:hypothetical protein
VYAEVDDSRQGCGVGPRTAVPACLRSGPVARLLTAIVEAGTAKAVATHETSNVVPACPHSGPVAGLLTANVEAGTAKAVATHETSYVVPALPHSGPVAGLLTANVGAGTAKAVANREAKLGRLVKEQKISPSHEYRTERLYREFLTEPDRRYAYSMALVAQASKRPLAAFLSDGSGESMDVGFIFHCDETHCSQGPKNKAELADLFTKISRLTFCLGPKERSELYTKLGK